MDPDVIIPLSVAASVALTVLSPVMIVRLILKHREKMIAMKYHQGAAPTLAEEVAALRQEIAALRETTTRCDVTFDNAIDRMEARLEQLEREQRRSSAAAAAPAGETDSVPLRRH